MMKAGWQSERRTGLVQGKWTRELGTAEDGDWQMRTDVRDDGTGPSNVPKTRQVPKAKGQQEPCTMWVNH